MGLSEETRTDLYRNTIKYLHDIAEKVPNTLNILKSYYASKFRISELQTKIHLEKSKKKSDERCQQCCLKLRETNPSYIVKPEARRSKFARKLLKKVDLDKRLTKYQAKYLKKTDLKPGNQLVITCNFCKKEVTRKCVKPIKIREDVNANQVHKEAKKKRHRKKKDKFCGLQQEVVATVQNKNDNNLNKETPQNNAPPVHLKNGHKLNNTTPKICVQNNETRSNIKQKNRIIDDKVLNRNTKNKRKKFKSKLSNLFKENNLNVTPKNNLATFLQSLSK